MSCTENESGSFVVFFLPAVVGCLTILLARRWATSQVSNTSSNAISRRRKIIKDPLAKRTLPTIACKMMPPGPKKAAGIAKKVQWLRDLSLAFLMITFIPNAPDCAFYSQKKLFKSPVRDLRRCALWFYPY